MNFVVTFALGVIVGGITMWQMARQNGHDEDEQEGSEAVSIEIVNGIDEQITDGTENNLMAEIAIEQDDAVQEMQVVEIENVSYAAGPEDDSANEAETPLGKLQQITGIGPTYSQRIYEAGIESVEDLARLTAEKLQEIVTPGRVTPTAETEKWLDQARQLAAA